MAKLLIKNKAEIIQEVDLQEFEGQIRIGSDEDNDINIHDKKISLTHLIIENEEDGYYIQDNKSAFGTYLNEKKINIRTLINDGDIIRLGDHDILFESKYKHDQEKISEAETIILDSGIEEKTKVAEISKDSKTFILEDQRPSIEKTKIINAKTSYYLLAIYGPYRGKRYHLKPDETRIGRDPELNDIILDSDKKGFPDTSISRRHATINVKGGRFCLTDKRSKTRTYYNTHKLDEDTVAELREKDEIEIVSTKKSTIFRFVKEGNWDFSPPKKAGVWWVRYRSTAINIVSGLLSIILLINIIISQNHLNVITQKPKKIKISSKFWLKGKQATANNEIIDENKIVYHSSPVLCKIKNDIIGVILLDEDGNIQGYHGKTGIPLWPNIRANAMLPFNPVLSDMDNDGQNDILISTNNSRVAIYNLQFGILQHKSEFLGGNLASSPSTGDINGDGMKDISVCSEDGWLYIGINTNGNYSWERKQLKNPIKSIPTLNDLDGDGKDDILIGTEDGKLIIYSHGREIDIINVNESLRSVKGTYAENHSIRSSASIVKCQNNIKSIMLVTRQFNSLILDSKNFSVSDYHEYPNPGFQYPISYPSPLATDLNLDNLMDFITLIPSGILIAYDNLKIKTGSPLWEIQCIENEIITTTPALCDFSKDNIPDVIVSSSSGTLAILDGKNGTSIYKKTFPNCLFSSSPVIGDIDNDGWTDILLQCANRDIIQFKTNMKLFKNTIIWNQPAGSANRAGMFINKRPSASKYLNRILFSILIILLLIAIHFHRYKTQKKMIHNLKIIN
jgi:pSer/pThr/pTyr-binding forkhead associated (FHA) protein